MKHARADYQQRIVDLQQRIGQDEPVMLFRAQDRYMDDVLMQYLKFLEDDPQASEEIRNAVAQHITLVQQWQSRHGCKTPDL